MLALFGVLFGFYLGSSLGCMWVLVGFYVGLYFWVLLAVYVGCMRVSLLGFMLVSRLFFWLYVGFYVRFYLVSM